MPAAVPAEVTIKALRDYDPAAVIALNNADAQHTSLLDAAAFDRLLAAATYAKGAGRGPDGFIVAMDETAIYENANFNWFRARYARFLYIDRIVVAAHARGAGLARRFYETLFAHAADHGCSHIGCEVNIDPPNPVSDAFHAAMGFSQAGQALLENGKTVRYMVRMLT